MPRGAHRPILAPGYGRRGCSRTEDPRGDSTASPPPAPPSLEKEGRVARPQTQSHHIRRLQGVQRGTRARKACNNEAGAACGARALPRANRRDRAVGPGKGLGGAGRRAPHGTATQHVRPDRCAKRRRRPPLLGGRAESVAASQRRQRAANSAQTRRGRAPPLSPPSRPPAAVPPRLAQPGLRRRRRSAAPANACYLFSHACRSASSSAVRSWVGSSAASLRTSHGRHMLYV